MISVFIIEDKKDYRDSIALLINNTKEFSCSRCFDSCESALNSISSDQPDVVLLDINLPGMSGVDGVSFIKSASPGTEIVMLTNYKADDLVFQSLKNGATGYILKSDPPENIISVINEVLEGGAPMSMAIARLIAESFHKTNKKIGLTEQQYQILKSLSEGKSYQSIANTLFIERTTVKYHIKNIYHKLHVHNKVEAVLKAKETGLI